MSTTKQADSPLRSQINWLRMEDRIRQVLRLVNQKWITESYLRDMITRIDEIVANETGKGNEITAGLLSGTGAALIQRQEWGRGQK